MTDSPHYIGHRKRLKERLRKDPKQLADYELLEALLTFVIPRRDTKPLAKELMQRFGSIRDVLKARPEELRKVKGLGEAAETLWTTLAELRARYEETPVTRRQVLSRPSAVAEMAISRLGANPSEEFWIALVDNKNRLIAWERVSRGTVNQAAVYPREVLALALERKAGGIIMVHNHPGGDVTPSQPDIDLTQRISRAAKDLDIRVLDHLIVTENNYYSFQAHGLL